MRDHNLNRLAQKYDRLAICYNILTPLLVRHYRRAAKYVLRQIPGVVSPPRVLDIGTGTGILAGAFASQAANVTGVDISQGMLDKARQKYGHSISFVLAPAHAPGNYPNQSFDVVTSGFVLHGLEADYRFQVLGEMKRLSNNFVAILDFIPNYNPVVTLVERMEGSFYKEFLMEVQGQLQEIFPRYEIKKLSHFMGLYLCHVHAQTCWE